MTNEMKLLRAFIEASGFTVDATTTDESREDVRLWKEHRDKVFNAFLVGGVPIGNRPKPIYDYKVTKTKLQQGLDDNILNIPNSKRLTKECIDDLLNPNKTVGGIIVLRYKDEKDTQL